MAIERDNPKLPIRRQCELLGLVRSSLYYRPDRDESYNEHLMQLIDEQYTKTPFYGVPRMTVSLLRRGHLVNPKRVRRLMRKMGLEAIYPRSKRDLSLPDKAHKKYSYLLKDLEIGRPDHVWATDITYVWTSQSWMYLAVVMDLFSRRVVGWAMASHLRTELALDALRMALGRRMPEPGLMHHSDRGVQYAAHAYQNVLHQHGIICSMSRKGDCWDNAVVESFFSRIKTELLHRQGWPTGRAAKDAVARYIEGWYNPHRLHSSLGYLSPNQFEQRHFLNQAQAA